MRVHLHWHLVRIDGSMVQRAFRHCTTSLGPSWFIDAKSIWEAQGNPIDGAEFYFKNIEDAILIKLMFGGNTDG